MMARLKQDSAHRLNKYSIDKSTHEAVMDCADVSGNNNGIGCCMRYKDYDLGDLEEKLCNDGRGQNFGLEGF